MGGFSIPTPEQLQYLMGIHPLQVAAAQQAQDASFVGNDENPIDPATGQQSKAHVAEADKADSENGEQQNQDVGFEARPSNDGPDVGFRRRPSLEGPDEGFDRRDTPIAAPLTNGPRAIEVSRENRFAPSESMVDMPTGSEPPPVEANPNIAGEKPDMQGLASVATPEGPRPLSSAQARSKADQERTEHDQALLDERRAKPSGVQSFQHRHGILGPIVRGLDIAGSIVAPGVMRALPGTTLNKYAQEQDQTGRVKEDLATERESSNIANREEVEGIRREADEERSRHQQAEEQLRKQAEEDKEKNRDIAYDPKTKQFTRGGQPYTPKDFQEGAILEIQHGIEDGPYKQAWDKEKRNQAPQTHIHNPSAEEEIYQDWRTSFTEEHGRQPNAQEVNDFRRGKGGDKDYTTQRVAIEKKKNDEFDRLERDFNRDWAKAETKEERDDLTTGLNKNKARVQSAYEQELAQIPKGEEQPPERITGNKPTPTSAGATPQIQPQGTYAQFAGDGKGNRIGYNPKTKKWEPVAKDQR